MKQNSRQSIQLRSFNNTPSQTTANQAVVSLNMAQKMYQQQQQPLLQQSHHQQEQSAKKTPQNRCSLIKGLMFAIFGAIMLHSNRLLFRVQYDYFYVSPNEAIFFRSLLFFFTTLAYAKYKQVDILNVPKTNNTRKWLYFRCIAGFIASWGMVNCLNLIQYSKSIVLIFTYPLFTIIFARIILKEKINFLEIIAICAGFLGVCIYANPQWLGGQSVQDIRADDDDDDNAQQQGNDRINSGKYQILGIIFAMIASITQGMVAVSLRIIGKEVDKTIPQLYFSLVSVVFFPSLYFTQNLYNHGTNDNYVQTHHYTWMFIVLIIFQGIFSFLGQLMWQLAYIYEKAARVAAISYLEIVLAFVFEAVLFHGVIQISDVVAAILIVGCSFLIAILKCAKVLK